MTEKLKYQELFNGNNRVIDKQYFTTFELFSEAEREYFQALYQVFADGIDTVSHGFRELYKVTPTPVKVSL